MTATGGAEPAYEAVISDVLDSGDLPGSEQQVLREVLAARIRRNTSRASHEVDQQEFSAAVQQISAALQEKAHADFAEPQALAVDRVDSVIDDLCARYHLPWPICPADD